MSVLLDRLLTRLSEAGLSVAPGAAPGQLVVRGPDEAKTPALMDTLKAFKPLLLERFATAPAPEPASARPTGRPPGQWTDPDGAAHRSGACRAVADGWLAWASYRAGRWYWFEEWTLDRGRDRPGVTSFRVWGEGGEGFATTAKFAAMFSEDAP